jgi:hypothetical protein
MVEFKVGAHVRWKHGLEWGQNVCVGTITAVIRRGHGGDFTLYEVDFKFGTIELYGKQLELADGELPTE